MDIVQPMLDSLGRLKASWPGGAWEWDSRFDCVASAFAADRQADVRACAVQALTRGWTQKSIDDAPASLRALCDKTGGLRGGQRLLAGTDDMLFGLWWPWGNGEMITLRIGFTDADATARLRTLFGV